MKTAVINNNVLSLILIEMGLDKFIIYNDKAAEFDK